MSDLTHGKLINTETTETDVTLDFTGAIVSLPQPLKRLLPCPNT